MSEATGRTPGAPELADRVLLAGMLFDGRHGVGEDERANPQPFGVDVALELDLAPAGSADDLARTVDYSLVHADVRSVVEGASVLLLETLAERIASLILERHGSVDAVTVRVRKLRPPLPGRVESSGVEIRRARAAGMVPESVVETLLALELALAHRDEAAIPGGYEAVLDEGFAETDSDGRAWARDPMLAALRAPGAPGAPALVIEDFVAEALAPRLVLARFVIVGTRPAGGIVVRSRRSSIWVTDGARWRLRFHHGTSIPG